MISGMRGIVSGKARRYKQGGFDLDLAYITDHIIAMSYPFEGRREYYRNPLSSVKSLLDARHKGHYMLFNLCSERQYRASKFGVEVACFPFEDHQAPPLPLVAHFCLEVAAWLGKDPQNVAVVHCKAGKGRTGTMICSYLVHAGICKTANEALDLYAAKRTTDGNGVTNPSQRRYVQYYADLRKEGPQVPKRLQLRRMTVTGLPPGDTKDLIVGVWSRPPGAGWKSHLMCLAAARPQSMLSHGHQPTSQQVTDAKIGASHSRQASLQDHKQQLLLANNTAVLDCDRIAPAEQWVLEGDVKIEIFKSEVTPKHLLAWTWFSTIFAPTQQTLSVKDLDHSKSLSAGSLTPCMYRVWTKWLKMARSVQEGMQLKIELTEFSPG
ncbi:hypothetical protein WJX77_011740 [Trebouxia sp. C0004]